jgi:hypothetical protein
VGRDGCRDDFSHIYDNETSFIGVSRCHESFGVHLLPGDCQAGLRVRWLLSLTQVSPVRGTAH